MVSLISCLVSCSSKSKTKPVDEAAIRAECERVSRSVVDLLVNPFARKPEIQALQTAAIDECVKAPLTAAEAKCVTWANTASELVKCSRPLGLANCKAFVGEVERVAKTENAVIDSKEIVRDCVNDYYDIVQLSCVKSAKSSQEIAACMTKRLPVPNFGEVDGEEDAPRESQVAKEDPTNQIQ